ncbi:MAG TPA: phosphotransferase [Nitrospirota bacterium]|nr:phosphotransferase [Nitrospirota bacterium]
MKPSVKLLSDYFIKDHGAKPGTIEVSPLGRGSHGRGYRVAFEKDGAAKRLIVKALDPRVGLGHDYPSDRAAVFILARAAYGRLPGHVRAVDVLALGEDGSIFSIDGGREYYLVMEEATGRSYFEDLKEMAGRDALTDAGRARVSAMAGYLGKLHAKKKDAPALYLRKVRDTVGHGECLMGVFDTYAGDAAGFTNLAEMAEIEKRCVEWRARLKPMAHRLSRVHGDFHPGNILFGNGTKFVMLDRSRGEYGEPADDLTALTINHVFFSLMAHGEMAGAYDEAIRLFYGDYLSATGDEEALSAAAPFYAFRGAVVANPLFYPDVSREVREKIFSFIHGALSADRFDPAGVNDCIRSGGRRRKRFI